MFECPFQRNKKLIQYRRLSCGKQGDKNGRNENRCGRNGFPVLQAEPEWEKRIAGEIQRDGASDSACDKQRKDYTESGSRFFWSQQTDGCFYGKIPDAWWIYPQRGNRTDEAIKKIIDKSTMEIPEAKAVSLVEATRSEYVHTMTLLENGMGKQEFSELMRLLEKANAVLQLERKGNNE